MITQIKTLALAAVLGATIVGCGDVGDAPKAKTGDQVEVQKNTGATTLAINPAKSKVSWTAAKVTRSHEGGFKTFSGSVSLNGDKIAGVEVTVDAASIYTDDEKLVGHLKSPDFFDVAQYPNAKFEASSFEEKSDSAGHTHMVTGNLTMHGVTHSVSFPAKINVSQGSVMANADFIINRQDWKIAYAGAPDDLIKDDVRIFFEIVADGEGGSAPAANTGNDTTAGSGK